MAENAKPAKDEGLSAEEQQEMDQAIAAILANYPRRMSQRMVLHTKAASEATAAFALIFICVFCVIQVPFIVAPLVIGYGSPLRDDCDYSETKASNGWISPNTFLIVAGYFKLLQPFVAFAVIKLLSADYDSNAALIGTVGVAFVMYLVEYALAIEGIVLYQELDAGGCKSQPAAELTLAYGIFWLIINASATCCSWIKQD